MKKKLSINILLGLIFISTFGCKAKKAIVETPVTPSVSIPAYSGAEVIKNINAKQPSYNTLAIKAKADLNINNNSNDVSMSIRIKNNEAIWVSVTALAGIEVARALITPDSIKVLNRMQNEYTKKPFSYIHQFTNKQVDFKTVQALFTANVFPGTLTNNPKIDLNNGQTQLIGNIAELTYRLLFNANYNLVLNDLSDQGKGQNLVVNYDDFMVVNGKEFPQSVSIKSAADTKNISISLKYNQITVDGAVELPFNVSKKFTVKN